jgi:hypothetical protein
LLASVLSFDNAAPGDRVLVLTGDSGLRVKARARRIEVAVPDESLETPPEPDDVERDLQKAQRELAELRNAAPDLKLCFGQGQTHAQFTVPLVREFDATTLRRLLAEWRQKHPHIGGIPDSVELPFGGGTFKMPSFPGLPGCVSAEDAQAHNAELDAVYVRYETYLRDWPAVVNSHARILPFNLVLENSGTAPADDIDVQFWTDAGGRWLDEIPKLPSPPEAPKGRDPYDSFYGLTIPNIDHLNYDSIIRPAANEDGPNISGDDTKQRVQYGIKRVKHHVPCELPVVYFQFTSDEAVDSFTVNVRIVAANIRKPAVRSLQIQVTRDGPATAPEPARLLLEEIEEDEY